ncbi:MAG: 50S ribosomal protein L25 [Bacillota bacterium]
MEQAELVAYVRDLKVTPSRLRAEGQLPAVIYGKAKASTPLWVSVRDFAKLLDDYGRTVLVKLQINGEDQTFTEHAIIREIQRDVVTGKLLHVDFHKVSLDEPIRTMVPIVVKGEEVVESGGGILQYQLREVEVECLPQQVPEELTVDVSHLKPGDSLTVKQLPLPAGVKVISKPEEVLLLVLSPKAAEEAAAAPATERTEPEVVAKGKAKEEEEE